MSNVKEITPENIKDLGPKEQNVPTMEQIQEVMNRDMSMIRLRASVLELKAIKFKLMTEMLATTNSSDKPIITDKEVIAKAKENITALLSSTMDIVA